MWANRLDAGEVNWYRHWKKTEGLKDEEDLWEHLKGIWEGYRTGLGDPAHMEALRKHFGPLLIDEAQSITPVQLKILALSSGHPESVVIGLDSKQSVGKETAARRRGVRPAVVEACDVAGVALQHSSIVLSINFRCPIGVLKVVDSVLQRWLKRHFKAEFDDFSVDKVVRSSLWESPPVLVCPDAEAAKKLLKLSQQNFFLLHGPGAPDPVLVDDPEIKPLLVLGLEDCRGLEFDTLCVLDQPFLGTDAKLIRKLDNGEDLAEAERDRCRDGFTTWLVLMTRCRNAAVVWIQDPHHPTIEWLQKEGGLVLQVLTDGQLAQAVSLLGKARRDELNSEVAVPEGPGPNKGPSAPSNREALGAIKALAAAMEIIGVRIDDRKDFRDLAASACELVRRASGGREPIDLELGLAALPAVLDRLWAGLPPLMDEQQHGLALTFFGPVVLRELERMRERRGWELDEKIAKGWDKVQKELRDMGYAV
ncbi:hypothetical protein DFJ74DRAFT_666329 [Hyaloraphidium curvatum]|nr:hypothetical protein DFJ74DRAFT_666329 [Hyaloraphidium curvatum]